MELSVATLSLGDDSGGRDTHCLSVNCASRGLEMLRGEWKSLSVIINDTSRGVGTASSSIAADDVVAVVESVLEVSIDERIVNAGGALG